MAIKLGNTGIGSLYLGSTKIAAAYLGSTKIYEASAPTPLTFVQQNFPVQWPTGADGIQFPTNLSGSNIERVQLCVLSNGDPSVSGYPQIELYVSQENTTRLPYMRALVSNTPTIGSTTYDSTTGKYSTTYIFDVPSAIASDLSNGQLYAYMITNGYGSGTVDGYDNTLCGYWATSGGNGGGGGNEGGENYDDEFE